MGPTEELFYDLDFDEVLAQLDQDHPSWALDNASQTDMRDVLNNRLTMPALKRRLLDRIIAPTLRATCQILVKNERAALNQPRKD